MNESSAACARMRALLLEVDMAELDRPDSPVARHLHECDDCAAAAAAIRSAHDQLKDALATLTETARPARRFEGADLDPLGTIEPTAPDRLAVGIDPRNTVRTRAPRRRGGRLRLRHLIATAAPLAAAAMLLLILTQQRPGDLPRLEPLYPASPHAMDIPVVNVTAGSDVAVMQTTNPNITVIWYLNREKQ